MTAILNLKQHQHAEEQSSHNCHDCKQHDNIEKSDLKSLTKKIHMKNGHECIDPHCQVEAPHGHNQVKVTSHEHHHEHKFPVFPLEDFIGHSKIPKWLKEFSLNASFLSPAMLTSSMLEQAPLPKLFKTWLAITAMHLTNRGKQKLPRLGLTYLVSGAASAGAQTGLGSGPSRFMATLAVAMIEKFSGNAHSHKKENVKDLINRDLKALAKNLQSKKQWLDLLPSLINIETKVQLIAPTVNNLVKKLFGNSSGIFLKTATSVVLTSLSFVATNQALSSLAKKFVSSDSDFAASLTSVCGCCGSPVCSAAATDAALNNSL